MADTRRLAAALAPFHEASKHLRATQARLSALVAAVTGEVAARTGNLERLPAAARRSRYKKPLQRRWRRRSVCRKWPCKPLVPAPAPVCVM